MRDRLHRHSPPERDESQRDLAEPRDRAQSVRHSLHQLDQLVVEERDPRLDGRTHRRPIRPHEQGGWYPTHEVERAELAKGCAGGSRRARNAPRNQTVDLWSTPNRRRAHVIPGPHEILGDARDVLWPNDASASELRCERGANPDRRHETRAPPEKHVLVVGSVAGEELVRTLARQKNLAATLARKLTDEQQRQTGGVRTQVVVQLNPCW